MKIYKIAQGSGGKVVIKLTTNKHTGEFSAVIVGHSEGAKCSDGVDDDILRDILNAEVEGFGAVMEETDSGHTPEYFAEKKQRQGVPAKAKPSAQEEDEDLSTPQTGKKLDLGFGV